ncbi:unnamed protein product [Parnassius mnemosyne]|uniref:Reverse transcriptase domain-containing protein n=1 Tax=Parnassius mnemosyne TaxID=213953 RepID=A0AAV1KRG6_9NEOP
MSLHILIFTETWLTSEQDACQYHLTNYTHIYNFRKVNKGGGVSIYIHNSIKYDLTEELTESGNHYLWIYINKFALNIGGIYKPGESNVNKFLDIYSNQLETRKRAIVLGDFNLDLLNTNNNIINYLRTIEESGYEILNKVEKEYCTRETATTHTILDHVCTNLNNNMFSLSILESSLSDHKQIFVEVCKYKPETLQRVHYTALDYNGLIKRCTETQHINKNCDYNYLENYIMEQIEQNKMTKTKILNLPQKDWINKSIIEGIERRNIYWNSLKKDSENEDILNRYNSEKKSVSKMIRESREVYYCNEFTKCKNKPKKMWDLINTLAVNKIKNGCAVPKLSTISGIISDGCKVCETFNNYFLTIGTELANNIHPKYHTSSVHTLMYKNTYQHNITLSELEPCSVKEVLKIINNINNHTSTGIDGISPKALKCIKNVIATDLTNCINKCLSNGLFPDSLKIAKVSPIHKSGPKTDPSNYRPISVLPVISKVFEKVIYKRLNEYFNAKNFFIEQQYGFRSKSNTLSAAIDVVTKIKTNIDRKHVCLGIFIDLKKAFDTVSHSKLLQKLNNIGITGTALDMLASYLANRQQIVQISNYKSGPQQITCGIPQGSILGPLLFLTYINNIVNLNLSGHLSLYADDTCLFYFAHSIHEIISQAQKDLDILNEWFSYNLLTINVTKTSFMVFCAKNKKIPTYTPLKINNITLKRSKKEKYLGLLLDDKLIWDSHIDKIASKLASLTGALRKVSNCIPYKIKSTVYNALAKPHLEYLIEIWGSAAQTHISKLQRAQSKLIKTLFHYNYLTPTKELYRKTKFLNIKQLYTYNTCLIIKKIISKNIHSTITFTPKCEFLTHNLRNKNKLQIWQPRTRSYGNKNIMCEGVLLYNNLPDTIKDCNNIKHFKNKLKSYIVDKIS